MALFSQNGKTSPAVDGIAIATLIILTLLTIFVAIIFLCKFVDAAPKKKNKAVLPIIFAIGFVVRLIFVFTVRGYREDYSLFADAINHLKTHGFTGYYEGDASSVLYPVTYFIYIIFGWIANITGLSDFSLGMQFFVKLPLVIADLLTAYGIYKIAKRYFNRNIGYVLCALVCVCPIFFVASSVWTSQSPMVVMFVVYAFYFLAKKNYSGAIGFATAAAFSGKEGIYIFPAMAVFSLYHMIKAIRATVKDDARGKELLSEDHRAAIEVPAAFFGSVIVAYLIGLFMTASYDPAFFKYIYSFIIEPFVKWDNFTYNGQSIYSVFYQNGVEPGVRFPVWVFAAVFIAIITTVVCVIYFSKKNRATMVMLAAYSLFTLQVYYPGSTAVSISCAFAAILAAYALVRDKRILYVLFVSGLCYVINTMCVLANAGYINNLADYYFTGDAEVSTLMSGGMLAVTIACSAITVASHLYFTFVTVSVGMSGQKQMLSHAEGPRASIREFFAVPRRND